MYRVAMQECNRDWIACVEVVAIVNGVPSQVYICLIQLLIFAQVCCVRSVVRFNSQNGHGRHPLKKFI